MRCLLALALLLAACEDKPLPRFEIEILYVIHAKVTPECYARIEALVSKTYPDLDVTRLEPTIKDQQEYYAIYRDRLLEQAGTSAAAVREKALADRKARGEGDPPEDDDPAFQRATFDRGFAIVQDQVDRELRIRAMFWYLLQDGKARGSLKAVFDRLSAKDDPKAPVCATEPGEGLLTYRHVTGTRRELEELEDSGVRFTHNFSFRVVQTAFGSDGGLPASAGRPDVLGESGQGRQIHRVVRVHREEKREGK